MPRLTGGQMLAESLSRQGVEVIFGLPGVQLDWAFDALYELRDRIAVYHTRHEQATAYMADGYARSTGRVGTCLVVPGPGLLNTMAALSTAYACSSPVLCIAGQIASDLIGKGRGVLHEIPDQLETVRSVVKWSGRAMSPEEIPQLVAKAFLQLTSGHPRPVEIEIPPDVLKAAAHVTFPEPSKPETAAGDPDLLREAARLLGEARLPIIFAGGGVLQSGAWDEVRQLAEMLEAPVITSANGKGIVSSRHHLAHGMVAGAHLLPRADAVLAVGTRFVDAATAAWKPRAEQPVVRIDVDEEEITRNNSPRIGIVADAKPALAELVRLVPSWNHKRESRKEELTRLKQAAGELMDRYEPQASYGRTLRHALPDDAIVVMDLTQMSYWSREGFPVYEPRTLITNGYQGTLGSGFPTALGAKVGNPARQVVAIAGDGGFMYNVQELATAVRHGIGVVTVVFNDQAYGNVLRTQKEDFGGHVIASDLRNPDFMKLADAFGVRGWRVNDPPSLGQALREALEQDAPSLIEVQVGPMPSVWPILHGLGRAGFSLPLRGN